MPYDVTSAFDRAEIIKRLGLEPGSNAARGECCPDNELCPQHYQWWTMTFTVRELDDRCAQKLHTSGRTVTLEKAAKRLARNASNAARRERNRVKSDSA